MAALRSDRRAPPDITFALPFATVDRATSTPLLSWAHLHSPKGSVLVRTGGLEPPRAEPDGFSYQLRLSPPSGVSDVCGLDYPFTVPRERGLGAARLVSTPSATLSRCGLARDCQLKGFPEFEQFCIAGFPVSTQDWSKSVASTDSATSALTMAGYSRVRNHSQARYAGYPSSFATRRDLGCGFGLRTLMTEASNMFLMCAA